jgi:hypothetical protein
MDGRPANDFKICRVHDEHTKIEEEEEKRYSIHVLFCLSDI